MWQGGNYFKAKALAAGRRLVRVNLDESSVALFPEQRQGIVFLSSRRPRFQAPPRMNVTRGILRTNLTYVAFATDDEELQEQLPNILIGNENTFPAGRFETLYAAAPDNFYLIRKKKAWNNTDVMLQIVRLLARIRSGLRANPFLLLVLDTAYCHINREVLAVCMTNDIFPLIVPACTTWLLQPLDVYVFRIFKQKLLQEIASRLARRCLIPGNIELFLEAFYSVASEVFHRRRWPDIFLKCGIGKQQADTSAYILAHLGRSEPLAAPSTQPTDADMVLVLPRKRPIPAALFFELPVPRALPAAPPAKRAAIALHAQIIPESLHVHDRPFTRRMLLQARARVARPFFVAPPPLEGPPAPASSSGSGSAPPAPGVSRVAAAAPAPPGWTPMRHALAAPMAMSMEIHLPKAMEQPVPKPKGAPKMPNPHQRRRLIISSTKTAGP